MHHFLDFFRILIESLVDKIPIFQVDNIENHFKEAREVVSQLSSETTEKLKDKLAAYKSANQQQKILLKEYRHLPVFTEQS